MKRWISFLLAVCLISSLLVLPASASETPEITVNRTTGAVSVELTGTAGAPATIKIEQGNTKFYLDSANLDDEGKYVFKTELPLDGDYVVTINVDGQIHTQPISTDAVANPDAAAAYAATQEFILKSVNQPQVASIGGEWAVLGLARAGKLVPKTYYDDYYDRVVSFVADHINDKGQLHRNKSTENARVILALTAICKDPTNVGGHNLLDGLTDMNYLKKQGINGPIWALIAFDSKGYEIPTAPNGAEQISRESLIDAILNEQHDDGGWSLSDNKAEPSMIDMTAMAVVALKPYYESNEQAKAAVDHAIEMLSAAQQADGGYQDVDGTCAESCAQVIVALATMGIDPHTDARFVKDGNSVVDALCAYAVEGGGFRHTMAGDRDGMASEQGLYALVAYFRFLNDQNTLFDMRDASVNVAPEKPVEPTEPETKPTEPSTKPTTPKPTDPKPNNNRPATGDESNATLYIAIMTVATAALVVCLSQTKKKKGSHD